MKHSSFFILIVLVMAIFLAGCITSPSQKDDQVPPKSYQNNSVSAVPTDILTVTPTVIKTTDESKKSAQKSQEKVKDISATDLEEAAKYVKKGLMLHQGTKYYNAIDEFDRALKINPNDIEALKYKSDSLISLGQYNSAFEIWNQYLEIYPNNTTALNEKGFIYNAKGNFLAAIYTWDLAKAIDVYYEGHENYYLEQVKALLETGHCTEASNRFDLYVKMSGDKTLGMCNCDLFNRGSYYCAVENRERGVMEPRGY